LFFSDIAISNLFRENVTYSEKRGNISYGIKKRLQEIKYKMAFKRGR